jgi:transcriptional regulator with XRE-family HTH domain
MRPLQAVPTPEENATLGGRLRFARTARKLSCNRLGELAGLGVGYVSMLERGLRGKNPGARVVRQLATALNVPFSWLEAGDLAALTESDIGSRVEFLEQQLARVVRESSRPPPMNDRTPVPGTIRPPGRKRPSGARNRP